MLSSACFSLQLYLHVTQRGLGIIITSEGRQLRVYSTISRFFF